MAKRYLSDPNFDQDKENGRLEKRAPLKYRFMDHQPHDHNFDQDKENGRLEKKAPLKYRFMDHQPHVNHKMRAILVDWLVQVHQRFRFVEETFYLTIAILDRYLQKNKVLKTNLQLVGVASMLIASKYKEMYAPDVTDFVYITDNGYNKDTICTMETTIWAALDFIILLPLPIHFLQRFSKAAMIDQIQHDMAKFFMELALVDYDTCYRDASIIAASSLFLSMKIHNENAEWHPMIENYSGYSESDMFTLVCQIANLVLTHTSSNKLQAVFRKFQTGRFHRVAKNDFQNISILKKFAESNICSM